MKDSDRGEKNIHKLIVERRKMDGVFGAVIDIVDADPNGNQRPWRLHYVFENRVAVCSVLCDLVDKWDGEVMVQRGASSVEC